MINGEMTYKGLEAAVTGDTAGDPKDNFNSMNIH
jgi:hypothetical protein